MLHKAFALSFLCKVHLCFLNFSLFLLLFQFISLYTKQHLQVSPFDDSSDIFRNRKGFLSINAQFVAGASGRIYNVVTDWPGSTHDAKIFRRSELCQHLEDGWRPFPNSILIGDSAYYSYRAYMAVPFRQSHLSDPKKRRYNRHFCAARVQIEQVIGQLKARFPILAKGLRLKNLRLCSKVIAVCAALHNFLLQNRDDNDVPSDMEDSTSEDSSSEDSSDSDSSTSDPNCDDGSQQTARRITTSEKLMQQYY